MTAGILPLLVDTAWLDEHLDDPDLRVFDCTGVLVPDRCANFRSESGRPRHDEGHFCGGGIGATAVAFALALIGRDDAAVYDGSMLECSAEPSLPVERGAR